MSDQPENLEEKLNAIHEDVRAMKRTMAPRSVRRRSETDFLGLPLWEIAVGPDLEKGEIRGHARAVIAVGDVATGVIAVGGLARGVVALGGCALGLLVGVGGLGIGVLALGGAAVGLVAVGGAAAGVVAKGGGALGYYAVGGGAFGEHVINAIERDPEAVRFFSQWIPGFNKLFP